MRQSLPIWSARGSEWHRWDPHIHAPGTVLEDGFGGDWEGYLTKIESAIPAIRALGVTDYCSIETYRQVRQRKAGGRLSKVEFLFPNVEMRLDVKTARAKGINIHLLFSPDDTNHEQQIERVLSHLMFEYHERKHRCSRPDLIALGREFDRQQTDDDGAFRVGVEQFKVTFNDLRDLFRQDAWLRENCLVAVAAAQGDGTSGLQADNAFAAIREEMERFAHVILSGNPSDREFWLGKKQGLDRGAIELKYRALKPCLHGCDAHRLERVAAPDLDRYCWIKGDLAFESLRQAVIEPEERVWISERLPAASGESVTIASIRPVNTPWLKNQVVDLNSGLVCVIGARGSGKTALVDLIAAGAHALGSTLGESSFLRRATDPDDLIGQAEVEENWADGTKSTAPFRPPEELSDDLGIAKVCYLSQHFVDRLCSSAGLATELREEIERVIFEQTQPTERYETDSFTALSEILLQPLMRRRSQQAAAIMSNSDKIADEERLRDQLPKLRADRTALNEQTKKAQKELAALLPKGQEHRAKRLLELEAACTQVENKIESVSRRQKALDDLLAETAYVRDQSEPERWSEMRDRFSAAGLADNEWENFRLKFSGDVAAVITSAKKVAARDSTMLLSGDPAKPVDTSKTPLAEWPLMILRAERDKVKKEVGVDVARQKRYDTLQRSIATSQAALKRFDTNIKNAESAADRRLGFIQARRKAYMGVFETFAEQEAVLAKLYEPLHQQLLGAEGALAKLRFLVKRQVRLDEWVRAGEELLDLRKDTRFRGHGALHSEASKALFSAWRNGNSEAVATAMHDFFTECWKDILDAMPPSVPLEGKLDWTCKVGKWLCSADHISIYYGLEYDGVAVEKLSPGTRGIVLLLLYLAIDRIDRRPLLIDQPEENLDPQSVFDDLVPHFREARKRRQVIIVTHNANLVVNTDADQVIVAASEPAAAGGLPLIKYESGSLENSEIRGAVCNILEGGERAFLERERRYRLQWERLLAGPDELTANAG